METFCFQIKKTKDDISIKLRDTSLEILQFYKKLAQKKHGDFKIDPESFIFPLLHISVTETDRVKIYNAISSAGGYINKDLRKLGKLAGIDKKYPFILSGIAGP